MTRSMPCKSLVFALLKCVLAPLSLTAVTGEPMSHLFRMGMTRHVVSLGHPRSLDSLREAL